MQCPYCNLGIRIDLLFTETLPISSKSDSRQGIDFYIGRCPECENLIMRAELGEIRVVDGTNELATVNNSILLYPLESTRINDNRIPMEYLKEFREANNVLKYSPKASAALSRRLLQSLLIDEYKAQGRDLNAQIDDVVKNNLVYGELVTHIDAIRVIGNFAAHPNKSRKTNEITEVEPGEAEWLLEVLEKLFYFTFVRPSHDSELIGELNIKLEDLNKPSLRGTKRNS